MNKTITHGLAILCVLFQSTWSMEMSSLSERHHAQSPLPARYLEVIQSPPVQPLTNAQAIQVASENNLQEIAPSLTTAQQRRNNKIQLCIALGVVCGMAILAVSLVKTHHDEPSENAPLINGTIPLKHRFKKQLLYKAIDNHLRDHKQATRQKHNGRNKLQDYHHKKKR